jgi:hypothetical protein
MPSFLSSLRRKSRANIKTEEKHVPVHENGNGHANGQNGNGVPRRKSSSTLNSFALGSSSSPATSTSGEASGHSNGVKDDIPPLPTTRPQRPAANPIKRYSLNVRAASGPGKPAVANVRQGMSTSSSTQLSANPSSLLAPRVLSVSDGSWVCVYKLRSTLL